MERIIFHIDVNNAFLSWESLYRINVLGETLDLRDVPSAIGGDEESRHGIVVAKSTPAKKFGIKTAETLMEARRKCPNLIVVPSRMHVYREYSKELMKLLRQYSHDLEQYSVDEAFLDMTHFSSDIQKHPLKIAIELKDTIYDKLGFTVNIGVSTNKILAKMASDFKKPNRVHSLFPHEIKEKMWPLPVGDLFFVGRATKSKLYNLGIRTIGELAVFDRDIICLHLGKHGSLIHDYANGIDNSPVQSETADAKGYGNSTTISHDVTDKSEAKRYLLTLCESVGRRLRDDHVCAGVVAITIKYFDFTHSSHQCTLLSATDVTKELYEYACKLFDESWDGTPIRLLGVSTSKISKNSMRQLNLLDQDKYIKQGKLENALDDIRKRFGDDSIIRASSLETCTDRNTHKKTE